MIPGLNSGSLNGYAEFTATIDPQSGVRSSSETSFLQEAISGTTLQIYQRTLAKKILFSGNKATGVSVDTAGKIYELAAHKEVIVASGAVSASISNVRG